MMRQGLAASWIAVAAGLICAFASPALADQSCRGKRLALVIGNSSYPDSEAALPEPIGNARAMADTLKQLGFDTSELEDASGDGMRSAVAAFEDKVSADAVVFLFFSGYGIQRGSRTYLIPVDAKIWTEPDVKTFGVSLDQVLYDLAGRGAALRIVVEDAARRNPYERRFRLSGSAGLASVRGTSGMVVVSSAVPGTTSAESAGPTSPFIDRLVQQMVRPGAMAEEAFSRARMELSHAAPGSATPWVASFLKQDVRLDGRDCPSALQASAQPVSPEPPAAAMVPLSAKPPKVIAPPAQTDASSADAEGRDIPQRPASPAPPVKTVANEDRPIDDPTLLDEIKDRLYEQNFNPGDPGSPSMAAAIRGFESRTGLPLTGKPTQRVLSTLRETASLKPWGAITFARDVRKWGMSWGSPSRREALAVARARCGSEQCADQASFFGADCGAFALSSRSWSITWRGGSAPSRQAALDSCSRQGPDCRIIGAVCADGSGRVP